MLKAFADWFVFSIIGLAPGSRSGEALNFFVFDTFKIFLLLTTIVFVVAIICSSRFYEQRSITMKIEVLGTGCAKCSTLYDNVKAALAELGKEADVVKVQDIPSIMKYGVMITPALVVDGQVKFSGKAPGVAELKGIL